MSKEETVIYQCNNIGIAGTTPVHIKQHENGLFEARCGFSLMGATNMSDEEFAACNYDPFNDNFFDNYAVGEGDSEEQSIDKLKSSMKATANSLWI